jgi:hypothetical protein
MNVVSKTWNESGNDNLAIRAQGRTATETFRHKLVSNDRLQDAFRPMEIRLQVVGIVTVTFMLPAMAFGAQAFGSRFRFYSFMTIVILSVFGVLTGLDAPRISANLSTPWVGIWERISIGAFLLWVAVVAIALWRLPATTATHRQEKVAAQS